MNCSPNALLAASVQYRSLTKSKLRSSIIYLLCEWANHLNPPTCLVDWAPDSSVASWVDSAGVHGGDLSFFRATADVATITSFDMSGTGITSFTGLECMPLLNTLRLSNNNLSGTIDLSVCPLLTSVELGFNQLSSVVVTGLSNLALLDAGNNQLPTTVVNNILVELDALGLLNGEVDLNAQSPSAPPSQVGRDAAANLIAGGWTVFRDEINWAPASQVFSWTDGGGANSGNLAFFLANADFDTVIALLSPGGGLVTSLSGLQGLIALSTVSAVSEAITTFDGRRMGSLTVIAINTNPNLTSLTFSGDTSLVGLSCFNCVLASLDITGCTSLDTVNCSINSLTTLNCSGLTSLTTLNCSSNASLTTLTLTGCTAITDINCYFCGITSLDCSGLTSLVTLNCHTGSLTTLVVSGCSSMLTLECHANSITSLDVSTLTSVTTIDCQTNSLTSLDVSACSALQDLACFDNSLTSLNVNGCANLVTLDCHGNSITSLNVSTCSSLSSLTCYSNSLSSLNISGCSAMTALYAYNNSLTSLDASSCSSLATLQCYSQYSLGVPCLTDIRIGNSVFYNDVEAHDNALPSGPNGVDDVLSKLATNCLSNSGLCDLDTAATNSSPTGGVLNADYVALIGASWTVNIN